MAFFKWEDRFSVKVAACDRDHQKLFSLIGQLFDAMQAGKGSQVVDHVVGELERYTVSHFAAEEALLAKTNYPALTAHRAEHQKFVNSVARFRQELKLGTTGKAVAVSNFLRDWLLNHIQQTDQKYSAHLNANGVH